MINYKTILKKKVLLLTLVLQLHISYGQRATGVYKYPDSTFSFLLGQLAGNSTVIPYNPNVVFGPKGELLMTFAYYMPDAYQTLVLAARDSVSGLINLGNYNFFNRSNILWEFHSDDNVYPKAGFDITGNNYVHSKDNTVEILPHNYSVQNINWQEFNLTAPPGAGGKPGFAVNPSDSSFFYPGNPYVVNIRSALIWPINTRFVKWRNGASNICNFSDAFNFYSQLSQNYSYTDTSEIFGQFGNRPPSPLSALFTTFDYGAPELCFGLNKDIYFCVRNQDTIHFQSVTLVPTGLPYLYTNLSTPIYAGKYYPVGAGSGGTTIVHPDHIPSIAIDRSNGKNRGRIYISYSAGFNNHYNICVKYSDDRGKSWSAPSVVSVNTGYANFFHEITVDQKSGVLYVLYHNINAQFRDPNITHTYLAFSVDGGSTFQNNLIDDRPFNDMNIVPSHQNQLFQQQLGLAAYDGHVIAIWPDNRFGSWQMNYTLLENINAPINGEDTISCFSSSPITYFVPKFQNISGVTYTWASSAGLTIVSGQGTPSIQVIPNQNVSDKGESLSVIINSSKNTRVTVTKAIFTALKVAPIAGSPVTSCANQNVYSVVNPVSGFKYSWVTDTNVTVIAGQGTPSITVKGVAGSANSTLTVNETGCNNHTVSATITIATNDLTQASANISGPSQINAGSSATFSVPPLLGNPTYVWTTSPGFSITSGQGTNTIGVLSSSTSSNEYVNLNVSECNQFYSSTFSTNTYQDSNLNWTYSRAYDENGPYAETKSFIDLTGLSIQSQVRNFTNGKIFASQILYDGLARPTVSTLSAPINSASFLYNAFFVQTGFGSRYNYGNFDPSPLSRPDPLGNTAPGTLGWYYGPNNTIEKGVGQTSYPFTQTRYYNDGTGDSKMFANVGDKLNMTSGHEVQSFTVPIDSILSHYFLVRRKFFSSGQIGNLPSILTQGAIMIGKDQNGKETVAVSDGSEHILMSARIGSNPIYTVTTSRIIYPYSIYYFFLNTPSAIKVTANTFTLISMNTEQQVSLSGVLPAGYYKAITGTAFASFEYTNSYTDISYNFYDQLGRLIASIPPNGVAALLPQSNLNNYNSLSKIPFITLYEYDLQGRLTALTEPDAGRTEYIYRKDGKIRFSQNAVQRPLNRFSYTNYDQNTRPIESGECLPGSFNFAALKTNVAVIEDVSSTGVITDGTLMDWSRIHYDLPDASDGFSGSSAGSDIVLSAYDPNNINITATNSITLNPGFTVPAGSTFSASINASTQDFVAGNVSWTENASSKTWYSYDDQGRVSRMVQNINGLGTKTVDYTYDMLGNVLTVDYQKGTPSERFIHNYTYDADKRLKNVTTTVDPSVTPLQQANFYYYLHGPLKRLEIGNKLQGLDYTYTPQGWLKAINHSNVKNDPGKDGPSNGFAPDAFGMSLEYFPTDYVNSGNQISSIGSTYPSSYNGNVAGFSWFSNKTVASKSSPSPNMYTYTYDDKYQLNSSAFGSPNFTTNTFTEKTGVNKEYNLAYDPNGNIQTLTRSNQSGQTINNFTYTYQPNTNQLSSVSGYANYGYDAIGQMTTVTKSGKTQYVKYGVRGEVLGYYKDAAYTTPIVDFTYNELGYRIEKHVYASNLITYYVHDASGNLLAIYDNQGSSNTTEQIEVPVYASSRIGTYYKKGNNYVYELTDHLGSTRVVMNGTKLSSGNADITRFNDYYPYGSGLQTNQGTGYRYDYQGQYAEKDPETGLNSFELRMYDPVIGRWMRTDPAGQFNSPYEGMGNNPVMGYDQDGGLIIFVNGKHYSDQYTTQQQAHSYWVGLSDKIANHFNDHNNIYADGQGSLFSSDRLNAGYVWAKANEKAIMKAHKNGEKIIIVSHSQGGAFAIGIQNRINELGIKVNLQAAMAPFVFAGELNARDTRMMQFSNQHDKVTGNFDFMFNGFDVTQFINTNPNFGHDISTFDWTVPYLPNYDKNTSVTVGPIATWQEPTIEKTTNPVD